MPRGVRRAADDDVQITSTGGTTKTLAEWVEDISGAAVPGTNNEFSTSQTIRSNLTNTLNLEQPANGAIGAQLRSWHDTSSLAADDVIYNHKVNANTEGTENELNMANGSVVVVDASAGAEYMAWVWKGLVNGSEEQLLKASSAGVESFGAFIGTELSADPADPPEGQFAIWQSDGTGSGDDGDIMIKITAGATTKTVTLVDFSAS